MAEVAVAVVSWNTRDLLRDCLRSLEADRRDGRAEVWVVDNGSTDGSSEMVAGEFPRVTLVAQDENLGFGPAINEVVRRTDTRWVAAANADIRVAQDALRLLLDAGARHPGAGAIAPRLLAPDGRTQDSVHRFPRAGVTAMQYLRVHRLLPRLGDRLLFEGRWDTERPRAVDWALGAFLMLRRTALEAVGGFDPEQWLFAEDIDICWRLRSAGWETRYEPAAAVHHAGSAATGQAFSQELTGRQWAGVYAWMARHRGWRATRALALVHVARDLAWLALLGALRGAAPRSWHEHRERVRRDLEAHRFGLRGRREIARVR